MKEIYGNENFSLQHIKEKFCTSNEQSKGYVVFYREEPIGYIRMVYIDGVHRYSSYRIGQEGTIGLELFIGNPAYLQKKLGTVMLNEFIRLHSPGIERIIVDPTASNARAITFFSNYGFKEIGTYLNADNSRILFGITIRHAVRGIIFNPEGKILLIRFKADPGKVDQKNMDSFWITPGGKVEKHEVYEEALKREIMEETGIISCQIGQPLFADVKSTVWDGNPVRIFNQFYVVQALDDKRLETKLEEYEKNMILEYKWWDIEEMATTFDYIFPRQLLEQIQTYLAISS